MAGCPDPPSLLALAGWPGLDGIDGNGGTGDFDFAFSPSAPPPPGVFGCKDFGLEIEGPLILAGGGCEVEEGEGLEAEPSRRLAEGSEREFEGEMDLRFGSSLDA